VCSSPHEDAYIAARLRKARNALQSAAGRNIDFFSSTGAPLALDAWGRATISPEVPIGPGSHAPPKADARSTPLAPLQAGMLYEAVLHGVTTGGGGVNVEQLHGSLEEALDPRAWAAAWTLVARRHPLLSSALRWEDVETPRREVYSDVDVPAAHQDWSGLSAEEAARELARFLREDRLRGVDLGRPPLMRVTLFTRGAARSDFVWTFHHVLLDGRSFARVLSEVFEAYAALARGRQPSLPPPGRDYAEFVAWLERRDTTESLAYFGALLRGKTRPTPLPRAEPAAARGESGGGDLTLVVEPRVAAAARALADTSGTSLATLVYAAWARVLAQETGERDVVFGVTRAGRRSGLDGQTGDMLGLFINTPPVRVDAAAALRGPELLATLWRQTRALRAHEHTPLYLIRGRSEFRRGEPLFETAVMFEHRDLNSMLRERGAEWRQRSMTLYEQPGLPFMLTAFGGDELVLRALFHRERLSETAVEELLRAVQTALHELAR
jgi:condensation domain-containing protein